MVQDGIYNNHYFWILIMDGMTINHIVSIDHGSYAHDNVLYILVYFCIFHMNCSIWIESQSCWTFKHVARIHGT